MIVTLEQSASPAPRGLGGEPYDWAVRSHRDPSVVWTVTLYPDGRWECECEGFRYHARADGLCRHIDEIQARWFAPVPGFAELP